MANGLVEVEKVFYSEAVLISSGKLDEAGQAFDLGRCTDALIGLPKERATLMLLRGMNPLIIAMDEITREEDAGAIAQICGCGVGILASAHAGCKEDLWKRPAYRQLLDRGFFSRLLFVRAEKAGREYRLEVFDS